MTYSQVNSSGPKVGDLHGELFAGDHGPEGAWSSLKGSTLTPPELSFSEQDANMGPDRLNQEVSGTGSWNQHVIVTTPLTRGGGAMAK